MSKPQAPQPHQICVPVIYTLTLLTDIGTAHCLTSLFSNDIWEWGEGSRRWKRGQMRMKVEVGWGGKLESGGNEGG